MTKANYISTNEPVLISDMMVQVVYILLFVLTVHTNRGHMSFIMSR